MIVSHHSPLRNEGSSGTTQLVLERRNCGTRISWSCPTALPHGIRPDGFEFKRGFVPAAMIKLEWISTQYELGTTTIRSRDDVGFQCCGMAGVLMMLLERRLKVRTAGTGGV